MSQPIIKVEELSKAYQIGQIGTGTISQDLERFFITKVLGKEDPFLKIGQTNDRSTKGDSNIVWSLQDINFEVNQGDAVGIIGKNGAGKSTLLKLLSRVTSPTTGQIKVRGRIASLLEVGTGFHPELTGRENIYLNGSILGMRKKEITRKLDEIIDFSGVERYIDTPVKRYSSGMYVRLAFAVAAHLESEILIVDEVLAVGDAEFQKKCLGKMGDISKGEGRTVLFVSHNMAAVKTLCSRGVVLENGTLGFKGQVNESVDYYLNNGVNFKQSKVFENAKSKPVNGIKSVEVLSNLQMLHHSEPIKIQIVFSNIKNKCMVGIAVLNSSKAKIFTTVHSIHENTTSVICEIPANLLLKNNYSFDVATFTVDTVFEYLNDVCPIQIVDFDNDYQIYTGNVGDVKIECQWYAN
jgi:lipopolysaccharide transport system ATP-binding protein